MESGSSDEDYYEEDYNTSKKKLKYSRVRLADNQRAKETKAIKKKRKLSAKNNGAGGKTFSYTGRKRDKKEENIATKKLQNISEPETYHSEDETNAPSCSIETGELSEADRDLIESLKLDFQAATENRTTPKTWQQRQADERGAWENCRASVFQQYVSRQSFIPYTCCGRCPTVLKSAAIRCITCKQHLCWQCDENVHCVEPFHRRLLVTVEDSKPLKSFEFQDKAWNTITKDVCIPCFVPGKCPKCHCQGKMKLTPNPDPSCTLAVVTCEGRFDLKSANFFCIQCKNILSADKNDYIFSGFWPGSATGTLSYLFSEELFLTWYHLRHKSPLNSENMFVSTLEEISKESGRVAVINGPLFSTAFKEWEICRLKIKVEILNMSTTSCPPCGPNPVMGSSDGNMKLRRRASAGIVRKSKNERKGIQEVPRFGDLVIKSDKEVEEFRNNIYTKIKREMCGGSAFKAAKIDSAKSKKSDETGLLLSVCRHGFGLGAINMHEGESMTYTFFLQKLVFEKNCQYFCSDVICIYEKFAKKVSHAFPEYLTMTKMKGFLPRMHAKAHHSPCQILYNPHWCEGVGLTVGEEHEQVFSKMSLYGYVTKHMSKANRIDLISSAILYWNWNKIDRMPTILSRRFKKARGLVFEYQKKLKSLLETHGCALQDLPKMLNELQLKAKANMASRQTKKIPVDTIKRNIEGLFIQMKNVSVFLSKSAESCKARTKFRRVLTKLKAKAVKLVDLYNKKITSRIKRITMEDFQKGIFPWDAQFENELENESKILSTSEKYVIVDTWMLSKRAEEEVKLLKLEMKQHLAYLVSTRSILSKNQGYKDGASHSNEFCHGKAMLASSEITRLGEKIQECLHKFRMYSEADFQHFGHEDQSEVYSAENDVESSYSDPSYDDESTETEVSDEIAEETGTDSDVIPSDGSESE